MLINRICLLFFLVYGIVFAQNKHHISATLVDSIHTISVTHKIDFKNTSTKAQSSIFLMDWANAFSSKSTPLAVRFAEDYRRAFHYANSTERGYTDLYKVNISEKQGRWKRPENHPDVVEILLDQSLAANDSITIELHYTVKIPKSRFTKFGYYDDGYRLKYWHLAPCAFINDEWVYYSHKNLNDFTASLDTYEVDFFFNENLNLNSNLVLKEKTDTDASHHLSLSGKHIRNIELHLSEKTKFYDFQIDDKIITSDIPKDKLSPLEFQEAIVRIYDFVTARYGEFPQDNIFVSYTDYLKQPVYGFTQLPKGFHPFKEQFKYEAIFLKQLTKQAKSSYFVSNLRTDQWFTDAIQVQLLMDYIKTYYPKEKLLGKFSRFIGVRWFHAADLDFNDQYYLGYKNMSSRFLQQSLTLPKDSLLKFNYNISNPYKSGLGLNYLEHFDPNIDLNLLISKFYNTRKLSSTSANDFLEFIENNATKDISWFKNDFLNSNEKVDIKIKNTKKVGDSIRVFLKNKGKSIPIKAHGFTRKENLDDQWIAPFEDTTSITFHKKAKYFALDFEEKLPEANRRNNYWSRRSLFHKPFQLRLLQDIEDPKYHQTFIIPVYDFNVNDGLLLGTRIFNKELFYPRNFVYSFTPSYGFNSEEIQVSGSLSYLHQLKPYGWSFLRFGFSGQTESFAPGLRFFSYTPSVRLSYRPKDLRSNLGQVISLRLVSIERQSSQAFPLETPNYRVLNARYSYSNPNLTNIFRFSTDFQLASNFGKASTTFGYRKLFKNNQWIDFRFYAGAFLFNNTQQDGDFFSFALDRPTDYLFDFNYLDRQDSGSFLSQQFITAEGNFKSRLNPRFANQWITTGSMETSIWKWVLAYGDVGVIKNKGANPQFLYDTGVKLNLVQDYLELYFPMQSSLGFEPSFDDYGKRIRFRFSLSIDTLIRLFTREWY